MRYYNADGGEAEMCGNGARCFARYADRVAGPREKVSFETPAGVIARCPGRRDGHAADERPEGFRARRGGDGARCAGGRGSYVDSGVPHLVVPVPAIETVERAAARLGAFDITSDSRRAART